MVPILENAFWYTFSTRSISQEDLEGIETDIDDILFWGKTIEEHDQRLHATPRPNQDDRNDPQP
jgi:hypothetical protein